MSVRNTLTVTTPNDLEVHVSREFDAPRDVVWDAMTKPEMIRNWVFGPPGWEMTQCEDDPRVGGGFRWAWRGPDGAEMSMHGNYKEVTPKSRVVRNEIFEMSGAPPMGEQLATLELSDKGNRTALKITLRYDSKEARDGAVASGMEHGMAASYDRLEELLGAGATR
jgi:uncharacterized protein YndB with AHSA1/START domain